MGLPAALNALRDLMSSTRVKYWLAHPRNQHGGTPRACLHESYAPIPESPNEGTQQRYILCGCGQYMQDGYHGLEERRVLCGTRKCGAIKSFIFPRFLPFKLLFDFFLEVLEKLLYGAWT